MTGRGRVGSVLYKRAFRDGHGGGGAASIYCRALEVDSIFRTVPLAGYGLSGRNAWCEWHARGSQPSEDGSSDIGKALHTTLIQQVSCLLSSVSRHLSTAYSI